MALFFHSDDERTILDGVIAMILNPDVDLHHKTESHIWSPRHRSYSYEYPHDVYTLTPRNATNKVTIVLPAESFCGMPTHEVRIAGQLIVPSYAYRRRLRHALIQRKTDAAMAVIAGALTS